MIKIIANDKKFYIGMIVLIIIVVIGVLFGIYVSKGGTLNIGEIINNITDKEDSKSKQNEEEKPTEEQNRTNKEEDNNTPVIDNTSYTVTHYEYKNGYLKFYNDEGDFIFSYDCNNKKEEYCKVAPPTGINTQIYNLETGIVDKFEPANYILNKRYTVIYDYGKEYSSIPTDNTVLIYDIKARKTIGTYSAVGSNTNSNLDYHLGKYTAVMNSEGKWGLVQIYNGTITEILPFKYTYIDGLYENLLYIIDNTKEYVYNVDTKTFYSSNGRKISNYNYKYMITNIGNEQGKESSYKLYKLDGTVINDSVNKYITFKDNLILVVDYKNQLSVYDMDYNKIINISLQLFTEDYHIHNGNASLSFYVDKINDSIKIRIFRETEDEEDDDYDLYTFKITK